MTSDALKALVTRALENENLEKYELKFRGGNEKGEGYIGELTFVDVLGEKSNGEAICYSLVLKIGGKNKTMRPIVRLGFEREVQIYAQVIPAFWKLQANFNMDLFSSIPKCYLTLLSDEQEALVLQNLKSTGFKLYNRKSVMTLDHMGLVLKLLGQWHALSFALKAKNPQQFNELTAAWKCPANEIFVNSHVGHWMNVAQEHLLYVLKESKELELLKKYQEKTQNKLATNIIKEILFMEEQQIVITHGDCWNNNLMFKYQANSPTDVTMFDFQISNLSSPVLDLSYFIYAVSSEEQLQHFQEFLQIYYQSLSQYLSQMDCDPQKIFSFADLQNHWKKYAAYGAMISPLTVCDSLVDKEDAVCYGNKHEKYESIIKSVEGKRNVAFWARLIAVAKHFTYDSYY
ncbi:unnamed protein product [Ceutorhynchus assimilis]|uniref:CHK kinase-like domain-containing protein n=1 Tax=Ceutorhynchus assimilis TaxID=467358 RepID=A0A9N9QAZ6_9CUCU|nr:unnamed protein product [Ceutorhynchus assimilis]